MHINALQAIILGVYYWHVNVGAAYGLAFGTVQTGLVCGLVLGDVATGIKIGAIILPIFLAFTGAGGTVVWDQIAGTIAGCVITMVGKLPIEQSVTIALPVALLFAQLHTIRRIFFAYPAAKADEAALKGNDRAIIFYGGWFCYFSKLVLYGIPLTLAIMLGAESIGSLMSHLPQWITNALSTVGGMLPALGFAMTIRVIGRPTFLPFFLGGFFLVQYTHIGGLFLAFVGLFFAFIYYLILDSIKPEEKAAEQSDAGAMALEDSSQRILTKKDCYRMLRRWIWFCEQSNSFSRLQSIAFCCAFIPALKKLYGNDKEEFSAALQRHLMFFNTQGIWGSVIHGIVLAMEEQRALGAPIDATAITGIKSGLMGPFAGIGDTIDWATLAPLLSVLLLPLGQAGNVLGAILPTVLLASIVWTEAHIYCYTGYRLGTRAALSMLQGKGINTFISCASVLGLFMMGGLSATMVNVYTPIYIPTSGTPMMLQSGILDKVAPGLLTLATVLGTYSFLQRGNTMTKATLVLLCIGLVLGAIGIIGPGGLVFHAYVAPKA